MIRHLYSGKKNPRRLGLKVEFVRNEERLAPGIKVKQFKHILIKYFLIVFILNINYFIIFIITNIYIISNVIIYK